MYVYKIQMQGCITGNWYDHYTVYLRDNLLETLQSFRSNYKDTEFRAVPEWVAI